MQAILTEKLHRYIIANNPDLLLSLLRDNLNRYLEEKVQSVLPLTEQLLAEGKPVYIIEEVCLDELTRDLRPSKFNYIKEVLEEEFEEDYLRLKEAGILTYEIMNMVLECQPVLDQLGFSEENMDDRQLRYAVIGTLQDHLHPDVLKSEAIPN